ncbi:hypothetical protein ACERII_13205 [Evansella sp. AB-rgal1]|uniref:hypothetical protein n=1 Tax=Evansella sp. AB-rgal1 TaxID=3242696 RepID=UPI00359E6073
MSVYLFILYQFLLFIILLLTNLFFGKLIGPPLELIDVLATILSLPIYLLCFMLIEKLYKRLSSISKRRKVAFSILAFLLAVILLTTIENLWYEFTGNMLF